MKNSIIYIFIFIFLLAAPELSLLATNLSDLDSTLKNDSINDNNTTTNLEGTDEITNTSFVTLRKTASQESEIIAILPFDEKLTVLERLNGWIKVSTPRGSGYMRSFYLKGHPDSISKNNETRQSSVIKPSIQLTDASNVKKGDSKSNMYGGDIFVRSEMKLDSSSPGKISKGGKVKILETNNGWCKIEFNGKTGYVRSFYLGIAAPVVSVKVKPAKDSSVKKNTVQNSFGGRPVASGRITSNYGPRDLFGSKFHYGIDFGVPTGTPAVSLGDGVVSKTGYDNGGGKYIDVKFNLNGYTSRYYHLKDVTVKQGQKVSKGQVIAHTTIH